MKLHWLFLDEKRSIYDQLLLEEALLRNDSRNFCIVNQGSTPAIVMGISGKAQELVDLAKAQSLEIPIIKRFSGGGTVIVDHNTLFVTFILQKEICDFPAYPERIMRWSEKIYDPVFSNPDFSLKENDYVIGQHKFGGNAQYIKKERWLHHTSFLWDFEEVNMQTLLHPNKTPEYRKGRNHKDFLCKMKDFFPSKEIFFLNLKNSLKDRFEVIEISEEELNYAPADRLSTYIL